MLAHLANYELWEEEKEVIKKDLKTSDDESGTWSKYLLKGKQYTIALQLAYDTEQGKDMIHLDIQTSADLKEKLEALDLFQSLFSDLIE